MLDLIVHMFFATKGLAALFLIPAFFALSATLAGLQALCDGITRFEERQTKPRS